MSIDRFIEIRIGVDDDGVLAAHLANDALQFRLARARVRPAVSQMRRPTSREPVKAIMTTSLMIDQIADR